MYCYKTFVQTGMTTELCYMV